jgi:hypothetical protein
VRAAQYGGRRLLLDSIVPAWGEDATTATARRTKMTFEDERTGDL